MERKTHFEAYISTGAGENLLAQILIKRRLRMERGRIVEEKDHVLMMLMLLNSGDYVSDGSFARRVFGGGEQVAASPA